MNENMFVKAQECTENMEPRSFEKESIGSALAEWVRASFGAIPTIDKRREFTDELTELIDIYREIDGEDHRSVGGGGARC